MGAIQKGHTPLPQQPVLAPGSYDVLLTTIIFYVHNVWLQKRISAWHWPFIARSFCGLNFTDDCGAAFLHLVALRFVSWGCAWWFCSAVTLCPIFYYWILANINSRLSLIRNKWKLQGRDNGLLWRQEHGRKKLWSFVLETGDVHPWGPTLSAAPGNRDGRVDAACLGSHSRYSPWGASTKKALLLCNQWQKG